jgi:hypothetical protein
MRLPPGSLLCPAIAQGDRFEKKEIQLNARTFILTAGATLALVAPAANAAAAKSPSRCKISSKSAVISLGKAHRSLSWQTAINSLDRGLHYTAISPAARKGCIKLPKTITIAKPKHQPRKPSVPAVVSSPVGTALTASVPAAGAFDENTEVNPYADASFVEYTPAEAAPVEDSPQADAPAVDSPPAAAPADDGVTVDSPQDVLVPVNDSPQGGSLGS